MQELILGEGLRLNAIRYSDQEAVIFKDKRYTYRQLNDRVNRLANGLMDMGLKKGDKAAIVLHNCNEYLELYLAMSKAGIISVPLTYRAVSRDLEYMVNNADSCALVFGQDFEDLIWNCKSKFNQVKHYISVGDNPIPWANPYEDLIKSGAEKEPDVEIHETDPIWITFTSGTTGAPKGCLGVHRGWVLQMPINAAEYDIKLNYKFLNTGPLYHVAPYWSALMMLYLGGSVVIMPEFDPLETLRLIQEEKINYIFMVPTMFNLILNLPDEKKKGWDMSSLKSMVVGAAPLLTKTKEEILKFFHSAELFEFYAATELGMVTTLRPVDQMNKVRCCGKPFTGVEIRLLDGEGREVDVGEVGELYMKGFNTFKEYYKNPKATAESRRGDWVTVGDMARRDEEGYYYIVDRKKDMVISGGVNIYPIEIDEVIQKHPKVLEVAVIGVPNEIWGESLKAIVVLKEGQVSDEEEILDFCKDKLTKQKIPRSVEFWPELPKTPGGKITKNTIRARFWKEQEVKI
jgi:acyl-CoA synthetase (AMP-forming)/AMP-acid ligase II